MTDAVFTDAARFKEIALLLLGKNFEEVPDQESLLNVTSGKPGLSAWIRNYGSSIFFRARLQIFFAREKKRYAPVS